MARIIWAFLGLVAFAAIGIGLAEAYGSAELAGAVVRGSLFGLVVFVVLSLVQRRNTKGRNK
ncbi:hypothetical protein [Nocardia arthritidis]|uniref:hypothetical protein n=1 Tax=Nocardia arthritidis TaxID=228602 RepID=UPI00142DE26E|nr:hypothetical protein [Nocardia arthritidis]